MDGADEVAKKKSKKGKDKDSKLEKALKVSPGQENIWLSLLSKTSVNCHKCDCCWATRLFSQLVSSPSQKSFLFG